MGTADGKNMDFMTDTWLRSQLCKPLTLSEPFFLLVSTQVMIPHGTVTSIAGDNVHKELSTALGA